LHPNRPGAAQSTPWRREEKKSHRQQQHFVSVLPKQPCVLPKGLNWRAAFGRIWRAIVNSSKKKRSSCSALLALPLQ
jgi:hypothetical protein